jgi:hypothetical protein
MYLPFFGLDTWFVGIVVAVKLEYGTGELVGGFKVV